MEAKTILVLALCATTSASSFRVPITPNTDLGAPLKEIINGVLQNFPARLDVIESFKIDDFSSLIKDILNITSPLKGSMHLSNIGISGINDCLVTDSLLDYVLLKPLKMNMAFGCQKLCFEGSYTSNMLMANIIPVKGDGPFHFCLSEVSGGWAGALALLLPFSVKDADYRYTVGVVDMELEGLYGDAALSKMINDMIRDFVNVSCVPAFRYLESRMHATINDLITGTANEVLSHFTLAQILKLLGCITNPDSCKATTTAAPTTTTEIPAYLISRI